MFKISHIDHVALAVTDAKGLACWYQEVLGLERRHQETWGDHPIMMCAGDTCVALFGVEDGGRPPESKVGMRHLAFRVDRQNFVRAQEQLRKLKIPFNYQDHQIAQSIYFADPREHQLELTCYEIPSSAYE